MFKTGDIKIYIMFRIMDKDSIATLERFVAQAPTMLREIHSIRINEILKFIQFLETTNALVADDPEI